MASDSPDGGTWGGVTPRSLGLDPALERTGFNRAGVLTRAAYDALVPPGWQAAALRGSAQSAVVLAAGGPTFFRAFCDSPEAAGDGDHPVDDFARRVVEAAIGPAGAAFYYWQRHGGAYADFVELARQAGLGAPGRLGLLLHPEFGPWLAIRTVVLLDARLSPSDATPLAPGHFCDGCPAPCASACPGGAVPAVGIDPVACLATRRVRSDCRVRCAARHACVLGGEGVAYDADAEEFFGRAALRDPGTVD